MRINFLITISPGRAKVTNSPTQPSKHRPPDPLLNMPHKSQPHSCPASTSGQFAPDMELQAAFCGTTQKARDVANAQCAAILPGTTAGYVNGLCPGDLQPGQEHCLWGRQTVTGAEIEFGCGSSQPAGGSVCGALTPTQCESNWDCQWSAARAKCVDWGPQEPAPDRTTPDAHPWIMPNPEEPMDDY
jgi:hypothetical protein